MNPESLLESLALLVVSFTSGKMKLTIKVMRMRKVKFVCQKSLSENYHLQHVIMITKTLGPVFQ